MMKKCALFGKCGGCKFDFCAEDYREQKQELLQNIPVTQPLVWTEPGSRRRANFSFVNGHFGFFSEKSKDVIQIKECPGLAPEINQILQPLADLPWVGAGNVLITVCKNGIDVGISSHVPFWSPEFKKSLGQIPGIIRATWNDKTIFQRKNPTVNFSGHNVEFPSGAFLQPSVDGEAALCNLISTGLGDSPGKTVDLFCGLGAFTFPFDADGFDCFGPSITELAKVHPRAFTRDLFKNPLSAGELAKYNRIIIDPPRIGASRQCQGLAKTTTNNTVVYVSCNPSTFMRDMEILKGYSLVSLAAIDQFLGSTHWELVGVFEKK